MGQRLNIEITDGKNTFANAYYHWSAYSKSAAQIAKHIISKIETCESESDKRLTAIRLLESTGAGLDDAEVEWMKANDILQGIKFKPCPGRNQGLIAISANGMDETRKYEEGRIDIDIVNKKINYFVLYTILDTEYETSIVQEGFGQPIDDLPECPVEISEMTFDQFNEFVSFIENLDGYHFLANPGDGEIVYGLIE